MSGLLSRLSCEFRSVARSRDVGRAARHAGGDDSSSRRRRATAGDLGGERREWRARAAFHLKFPIATGSTREAPESVCGFAA